MRIKTALVLKLGQGLNRNRSQVLKAGLEYTGADRSREGAVAQSGFRNSRIGGHGQFEMEGR